MPAAGVGVQGIQQRYRHGVADDGQRVDLLALDDIPHLLTHQGVRRVEHHGIARQQHDTGVPPTGAVHQWRQRHADDDEIAHPVGNLPGRADGPVRMEPAAATHGGEKYALVRPHHALGHAGGAAGVEDEQIVVGALAEVPRRALPGDGRFQFHRADGRRVTGTVIGNMDTGVQRGRLLRHRGDMGAELLMVDAGHHVGVGEYVRQLVLHVAIVDVDGHCAQFETGEHRLQVLIAVVQVQAHMVTGPDAPRGQEVGKLVRPALQGGVADPPVATDQGDPLRHLVRHQFEHVGDIEMCCHGCGPTPQGLSAPTTHMAKNWAPPP